MTVHIAVVRLKRKGNTIVTNPIETDSLDAKLIQIDTTGYSYHENGWELGIMSSGKFMTAKNLDPAIISQGHSIVVLIPMTAVTAVHFQTKNPIEAGATDAK